MCSVIVIVIGDLSATCFLIVYLGLKQKSKLAGIIDSCMNNLWMVWGEEESWY